ncbi:DUF7453 family protein [Arthrobacter sp. KK5.5]|uniref:DUF7453 family protein n=1 Tax=Arthrobacter sp. KK5.5 TaxID=3373084 RepID=UPI003EE61A73
MKASSPTPVRRHGLRSSIAALSAAALVAVALPAPAVAADSGYIFTKVLDSAQVYEPNMFGCAAINERGDIVTKTGRLRVANGETNSTELIIRANANGGIRLMVNEDLAGFRSLGRNPKINDSGQVSFWARGSASGSGEVIATADGISVKVVARTAPDGTHAGEYRFFGVDTTINNHGTVAFRGELDNGVLGMWSGSGGTTATHYLNSEGLFSGDFDGVSINDSGQIAFEERANRQNGIFRGAVGDFTTIASNAGHFYHSPSVNESGTVAFHDQYFDETGQVFAVVTGSGGELTTVADTSGAYSRFPFRGPAINNNGKVAFKAELDSNTFPEPSGIFTGPDPVADRVIGPGDSLGGEVPTDIVFCEDAYNTAGQLAFTAYFEDPVTFERRAAVYRATPVAP